MSEQQKRLHGKHTQAPQRTLSSRIRQLTSADRLTLRTHGPDDVLSYSHARVLLKGDWCLLYQALERASIEDPDVVTVDRLVTHAALALAARSLAVHIQDHRSLYYRSGVAELHIGLPDELLLCASTVWGDTDAASLITDLQAAVESARQARDSYKDTPHVFWPVVGGFYSAPDAQPEPSSATWSDVMEHPERYALIPLHVTARFVVGANSPVRNNIGSERHGKIDWWLCRHCGRCYQDGERRIVAGRNMCPYLDCQGQVVGDTMSWDDARLRNADLPQVPRTGSIYPL
jgi:hypothetical protein